MNQLFRNIAFQTARLTGWRWLVMLTGLSLLAACSGNSDKKNTDTGNKPDSENVTCYAPQVKQDTADNKSSGVVKSKTSAEPDSQTTDPYQPPPQTCYAPIDPSQLNN